MTAIQLAGSLLAASTDDRTLSYLLLPFNEEGRTSVGRVTASKGSISIPESLIANLEHDGTRPVARSTSVAETDQGIVATFHVLTTTAGNDLLIEAREGVRTGISVEIDNPTIRNGALVAGELTGAGFVTRPAFPSAQLVACDCGDDPEDTSEDADGVAASPSSEAPSSEATAEESTEESTEDEMENTASAPADLMVASRGGASKGLDLASPSDVAKLVASIHANPGDTNLLAALSDVTQTSVYDAMATPQYIGQLWDNRNYTQKYAPLIGHDDLTAMKIVSWRFKDGQTPVVGDYAGNKAAIPSNAVTTEALTETAARLAGGWDVDRIMVDFPNPEFWSAFFKAATDDYARKIDAKVLTRLKADAVAVTGAGAGAVAKLIKGARALDEQEVGLPTFAIMGWDLYETYLSTTNNNVAVFLSQALGISEGNFESFRIVPSSDAGVLGKVLVGTKACHTLFELAGSPIRVSALDLAKGGTDEALFGYYATVFHGKGLVSVA